MELARLQSSPANQDQSTSTSKRLSVRGFPPGILLQLRVAVVARGNSMGSLTLSTLSTAAAAALPAAAELLGCVVRQAQQTPVPASSPSMKQNEYKQ